MKVHFYSGLAGDDAPHEKSVALILSKAAGKSLKEREPISERIISAMFESKCQNTTIMQVYAPTNEAEENVKTFTTSFRLPLTKGRREILPWLSVKVGLNAKVGSDNRNRKAPTGNHDEGVINENGEMFC